MAKQDLTPNYALAQIGEHFGLHYASLSRIARSAYMAKQDLTRLIYDSSEMHSRGGTIASYQEIRFMSAARSRIV